MILRFDRCTIAKLEESASPRVGIIHPLHEDHGDTRDQYRPRRPHLGSIRLWSTVEQCWSGEAPCLLIAAMENFGSNFREKLIEEQSFSASLLPDLVIVDADDRFRADEGPRSC